MAVNPLDLQTNFMQINTVSKKEVLSRDQEILRQDHAAEQIKKDGNKNTEDIPVTKEAEALEKLKKDKEKEKQKKGRNKKTEEIPLSENTENDEKTTTKGGAENGVGGHLDLLG